MNPDTKKNAVRLAYAAPVLAVLILNFQNCGQLGNTGTPLVKSNSPSSAAMTFVSTTFNEQTAGSALAASTPATCTEGCTGSWTASAGQPSPGAWAYSTNSITITGNCTAGSGADFFCPVYINAGQANYTLRFNVSTMDSQNALSPVLRWTNNTNFITVLNYQGTWEIYDVVNGTNTIVSTAVFGAPTGLYTVVVNGNNITLTNGAGTITGIVSSSNVGTNVGLANYNRTGSFGSDVVTSLSVMSY